MDSHATNGTEESTQKQIYAHVHTALGHNGPGAPWGKDRPLNK